MEYPFVILGFIPELAMHQKEISRTLLLPLPVVRSLCERHVRAIVDKHGTDPGISHGDIITAVVLQVCFHQGKEARFQSMLITSTLRMLVLGEGRIMGTSGPCTDFGS